MKKSEKASARCKEREIHRNYRSLDTRKKQYDIASASARFLLSGVGMQVHCFC
jgi:hypothetical protein